MARKRTVKSTPKRGKLTKRQVERAVRKVIQERRERGEELPALTYPAQASPLLEAIADALDISERHLRTRRKTLQSDRCVVGTR